jgi:hypothetical protein
MLLDDHCGLRERQRRLSGASLPFCQVLNLNSMMSPSWTT